VHYQQDLVSLVNENVRAISIGLIAFSVLLLLVAVILINNTIRLSIYSKRFLIKSMQLVGATGGFIRKPFVVHGILQGLIGSVAANLMLLAVIYVASRHIPGIMELQDVRLLWAVAAYVMLTGVFISWISTVLAVRKYLKIKTDFLY